MFCESLEIRNLLTAVGDGVPDGAVAEFVCDPNSDHGGDGEQFCQAPVEVTCEETEFPDVDGDGDVTPVDALLLINHINSVGSGQPAPEQTPPVLDLNCDGIVTPADVMIVINFLNGLASAENPPGLDLNALVQNLGAGEGESRLAATNSILDLGSQAAPALAYYGAEQISPVGNIETERIDVVYSLIAGLEPIAEDAVTGYGTRSFGLHLEEGTTTEEVDAMGEQYGFSRSTECVDGVTPNCYATLLPGLELEDVLEDLLRNEPAVVSVNLNYYVA